MPVFILNSMYPKLWSVSKLNYKTLITDLMMLGPDSLKSKKS
ncbi:hypothetical protein KAI92_01300 [Candidatus Parcubacteria bacterium]|nr:hypothetical protein [Candidatus Parcubacteria bacterium]